MKLEILNQAEFIQMKRLIVYSSQHGTLSSVSIDNYYQLRANCEKRICLRTFPQFLSDGMQWSCEQ